MSLFVIRSPYLLKIAQLNVITVLCLVTLLFSNASSIVSATLSLGVVYTSFGQLVFGTEAIEFGHLIMIGIGASLPTLVMSAIKEVTKVKFL